MRSRAAIALILAFAWHLLVPVDAWSLARAEAAHLQTASPTDGDDSSWVPRAERCEALGYRFASGGIRPTEERVASASTLGAGLFAALRHNALPHCPSYPARRRLLRRNSTARDDGPA